MNTRNAIDDVFVNCPFDEAYRPIFRAITFAVFACGFRPRSALEVDDGGYARLEKIMDIIAECRLGVHDLSRTELDPQSNLPRFNMPLELGIFLGAKRFDSGGQSTKRALVMDTEQYRYQQFISDISGMDIQAHNGEAIRAVTVIRNWLTNVSKRRIPAAPLVVDAYHSFMAALPVIAAETGFDPSDIPYVDFEFLVTDWLLDAQQ